MATHWTLPQKDLFEPLPPVSQLTETERREALDLMAGAVGRSDESRAGDRRPRTERRRAMTKISPNI